MKYGEIEIVYNSTNILTSLAIWLNYEPFAKTESQIILSFEGANNNVRTYDNTDQMFDTHPSIDATTPSIITRINPHELYFRKTPDIVDNKQKLDFQPLFKDYEKFDNKIACGSYFNCIYYCFRGGGIPRDVFGIVRMISADSPRYLFAYDTDEFTQEDIEQVIGRIFTNSANDTAPGTKTKLD